MMTPEGNGELPTVPLQPVPTNVSFALVDIEGTSAIQLNVSTPSGTTVVFMEAEGAKHFAKTLLNVLSGPSDIIIPEMQFPKDIT